MQWTGRDLRRRNTSSPPVVGQPPLMAAGTFDSGQWLSHAVGAIYAVLSPMERSVLLAAARGAEDKEIAAALGCSLSTVRTLWQRTYRKTHTTSRRRLVATLWDQACHLASCHFLNDVTGPPLAATITCGEALNERPSTPQQLRDR
jgi:DNA-binding CsgD family transcriptional regulator